MMPRPSGGGNGPVFSLTPWMIDMTRSPREPSTLSVALPSSTRTAVDSGFRVIRDEVDTTLTAIRILLERRSLATEFPDGGRLPEIPSPRQVIYLNKLAGPSWP